MNLPATCSVIVVTRGRPDSVRRLLRSIAHHAPGVFERVVVVDDSPDPVDLASTVPELNLRHVRSARRLFVTRAKNLGLGEVDSEYVMFVDDDNEFTDSTLHALQLLTAQSELGAVMPSVLYRKDPTIVWVYATPFRPDRWEFDLVGRNRPREPALEGRVIRTDALPNASFLRRRAIQAVGGFDERLPSNSSADLCQRLIRSGFGAVADTAAFVLHDVALPSEPGFWAEHSAIDPDRAFYEAHDWFVLQLRVHQGEPGLRARAALRSLRWVLPFLMGVAVRSDAKRRAVVRNLALGWFSGLRAEREGGAERAGTPGGRSDVPDPGARPGPGIPRNR